MRNEKDAKKEIEKGEKESAATSVVNPTRGNTNVFGTAGNPLFKLKLFKTILVLLPIIAISFGAAWLFYGSTYKKETTISVEQIREIAKLATAEAHVKVVIEEEDNKVFGKDISVNFPGTKRELLLIVPATVTAGIDLKEITSNDIKIDEKEKRLAINVPRATLIQEPAIQMDRVQTFSDEGLFRGEMKWDEGFNLAAEAQQKIKDEAIEMGLLASAEKNAEKVLESFFSNLGYTVELTFK